MRIEVITRESESNEQQTPVLSVHGMYQAAWCWSVKFQPYFAQHGYKSQAISLRGCGASDGREHLRMVPLADFVSDLAQVVDQLESSPVLIGRSMGAMVVQKYLESHQVPAAVMLGSAPPIGATDDSLISSNEVRATAKAYNTQAEFFTDIGHAMMLDIGWQAVADRILN